MPLTNFIKSLFKSEGHGASRKKGQHKTIVQVIQEETAVDKLQSYLKNVQLRIEVLEYYQSRYHRLGTNPWIPEYRIIQMKHRLLRLESDAEKLRARITVLKLLDCDN